MKNSTIYFLLDPGTDAVKIGRSNNPKSRLKQLQTGNAYNLKLLYVLEEVCPAMEKHLHGICSRYHLQGEWFSKDVLDNHLLLIPYYKDNLKEIKE